MYFTFRGASIGQDEDGERVYKEIGAVTIAKDALSGFYDHTLLVGDHKIRVVETYDEILKKVSENDVRSD